MKTYDIAIAGDHSGYHLKDKIINHLKAKELSVQDFGTNADETVDYPDYAKKVVESILEGEVKIGILTCGTGIGMSIAANRRSGIRAALCFNLLMAERARSHNNANILILGSKIVDDELALQLVDKFLNAKFEGGRHSVRLAKLS